MVAENNKAAHSLRSELRHHKKLYEMLFEQTSDYVLVLELVEAPGAPPIIVDANEAALKKHGYTRGELIGQPITFLEPEAARYMDERHRLVRKGGIIHFEGTHRCKNGGTFVADIALQHIRIDGRQLLCSVERDISERKRVERELAESHAQVKKALEGTILAISKAVEARDPYTSGHEQRVEDLALAIAEEMGFEARMVEGIRFGALIHDIGKLSVPAEILTKPAKLTAFEYDLVKQHPSVGYEILKDVPFPWPVALIAYQHHERMDGSGYPLGLKGDETLMEARVVAVADVVDSMAGHRPYRKGLGIDSALDEISLNRGKLYDAAVVDACLKVFRENGYSLYGDAYARD